MKLIFSLFANKIVNEELELIQKALVITHDHYVSCGNFDDAFKITKLLSENQNEEGCFIFKQLSENPYNFLIPGEMEVIIQPSSSLSTGGHSDLIE